MFNDTIQPRGNLQAPTNTPEGQTPADGAHNVRVIRPVANRAINQNAAPPRTAMQLLQPLTREQEGYLSAFSQPRKALTNAERIAVDNLVDERPIKLRKIDDSWFTAPGDSSTEDHGPRPPGGDPFYQRRPSR